jgi:hypothetical protein
MTATTPGMTITLAALADRWHATEAQATELIWLIPMMSKPDGADDVDHRLQDGSPLWPLWEVESAEASFPELAAGGHEQVCALMRGLLAALDEFGTHSLETQCAIVCARAEKSSKARAAA